MFNNGHSNLGYESLLLNNRPSLYYPGGVLGRGAFGTSLVGFTSKPASNLYAGKWTLEEERFVTFLCEEFRAGSLDIPEGKSLRCYLAEQLGCNAKRISKKYERTGYNGKLQYVDKRSTMTVDERTKRKAQLEELDRKFRESRETLKIVEASRKRTATTTTTSVVSGVMPQQAGGGFGFIGEPSLKKQRTDLLNTTSTTAAAVNSNLRLAALQGAGGVVAAGGASSLCDPMGLGGGVNMMESMLLRRSMLAARTSASLGMGPPQVHQTNNDIVRASMLTAIQKYGGGTTSTTTATIINNNNANAAAAAFAAAAGMDPPANCSSTTATAGSASPAASSSSSSDERAVSPSVAAGLLAIQKRASLSLPGSGI